MEQHELHQLMQHVADGSVTPDEAEDRLRSTPFTDLGYAKVDNHRGIRQGVSEIIYGEGKTPEQVIGIIQSMADAGQDRVLITRLGKKTAKSVGREIDLTYDEFSGVGIVGGLPENPSGNGSIVIAAAGTSDLAVAEEAALSAEFLSNEVVRLYDVGVAGIHRLLAHTKDIQDAQVIIAVAGMEGALPSVIAGLASCPVIAVPTSVGYGASFGGAAALLAMLNSCASGVSVVNIDNGFGAAYQASLINHVDGHDVCDVPDVDAESGSAQVDEVVKSKSKGGAKRSKKARREELRRKSMDSSSDGPGHVEPAEVEAGSIVIPLGGVITAEDTTPQAIVSFPQDDAPQQDAAPKDILDSAEKVELQESSDSVENVKRDKESEEASVADNGGVSEDTPDRGAVDGESALEAFSDQSNDADEHDADAASDSTSVPDSQPTSKTASQSDADLAPQPDAESTIEPGGESATAPTEQTTEPAAEQTAEPVVEPAAEPAAEPTLEPAAEPATPSNDLILDLRKDATRHYIYADLLARLSEEVGEEIRKKAMQVGVPDKHHADLAAVNETIEGLRVSDRVKADMKSVYIILATAEAHAHGCEVEQTHFHEVGNAEAIRNVVGICLAIEALNPDRILCSAVQVGSGSVKCAHGVMEVPAPATAAILALGIPIAEPRLKGELCTPTSAAVIAYFVDGFYEVID